MQGATTKGATCLQGSLTQLIAPAAVEMSSTRGNTSTNKRNRPLAPTTPDANRDTSGAATPRGKPHVSGLTANPNAVNCEALRGGQPPPWPSHCYQPSVTSVPTKFSKRKQSALADRSNTGVLPQSKKVAVHRDSQ